MIDYVNLLPEYLKEQRFTRKLKVLLMAVAVLYVLAVAGFYTYQMVAIRKEALSIAVLKREKESIIKRYVTYQEIRNKTGLIKRSEDDIKRRMAVVSSLLDSQTPWFQILRFISRTIPDKVWLSSLSTSDVGGKGKVVRFGGTAASNGAIAEFIFTLENSRFFRDVDLIYSQKKEVNDPVLFDFEIDAGVRSVRQER